MGGRAEVKVRVRAAAWAATGRYREI